MLPDLVSSEFNPFLQLFDATTGEVIAYNDGLFPGLLLDSQLQFIPETGINYAVGVSSFGTGEIGSYTLSSTSGDIDIIANPLEPLPFPNEPIFC